MAVCMQCPRACGVDRAGGELGFCRVGEVLLVSRVAPHLWEEPCISGQNGSGTVFFSGCNLRCIYCQNRAISRGEVGRALSPSELADEILALAQTGVHNINLVTPTHYTIALSKVLETVKPRLHIPVVWNSGGYESVESLRRLEGLVDIYLPDCKYASSELAAAYSAAPDYFPVAMEAIGEMLRQAGPPRFSSDNSLLCSGVILRHLVLPGHRADSIALLQTIGERFSPSELLLSLMRQYTPDFALDCPYPNLHRRVTTFEYQSVLDMAAALGFRGFSQGAEAASAAFTPAFSS